MTQPIQDQPADVPLIPSADAPLPQRRGTTAPGTVPARRGLEADAASPTRRHLSRRVRRGEPREDG